MKYQTEIFNILSRFFAGGSARNPGLEAGLCSRLQSAFLTLSVSAREHF